jgi:hypothetical protein
MNINLTHEQEKIVKDELKSGHFRTVEEVIAEALQALREKEQSSPGSTPNGMQREPYARCSLLLRRTTSIWRVSR